MSTKKTDKIAIIKNQTVGGGERYSTKIMAELRKKFEIDLYSPIILKKNQSNTVKNLLEYIKYVYFYLPQYYQKTGEVISQKNYRFAIVFQDAFRKCPDIFDTLKIRNIYILHEPPREFYEPINFHAPRFKDKIFTFFFRWPIYFLDRKNTKKAKIIVSNSKFSKNKIKEIYGKDSFVIYPGSTKLISSSKEREFQCISVGSLLPYKGHDLIILSLARIKGRKPNLLIIGNGSTNDKQKLLNLAKKLGINLSIKSDVMDNDLGNYYRMSKVYINAAFQEPFGMTSLEALDHGCNLVSVNDCGTIELKSYYKNQVFIAERNPNDLSCTIIKALKKTNPNNPNNYFKWQRVARDIATLME